MQPEASLAIPVRFTNVEMETIHAGLHLIEQDHLRWQKFRLLGFPYEPSRQARLPEGKDECDEKQMAVMLKLRASTFANPHATSTRRMRLTVFELAACALGVRVIRLWYRLRKLRAKRRNYRGSLRRLSVKLENLRKVAKRLHVRSRGKADYDEVSRSWRRHIQWMRATFVFAFFFRWKPLRLLYRWRIERRRKYAAWVESVKEEMRARNLTPPPDAVILQEVKKAHYYVGRLSGLLAGGMSPERRAEITSIIWDRLERKLIGPAWACQCAENAEKIRRAMGIDD